MKVRYSFFALLFALAIYGTVILTNESSELTYLLDDENLEKQRSEFESGLSLVCNDLKEITEDQMSIDLAELPEKVKTYFNDSNSKLEQPTSKDFEELIQSLAESRNYIILRKSHLCFSFSPEQERLLPQQYPGLYRLKEHSFGLAKLDLTGPAQGVLIDDRYQHSTCGRQNGYSRFSCLDNCLKVQNASSGYVQYGNETGVIELAVQNDPSFLAAEKECEGACEAISQCKLVYHFPSGTSLEAYRLVPTVEQTEYWLKLFRLICLLIGLSFFGLLYKSTMKIVSSKVEEEETLKIWSIYVKVAYLLITAIILFSLWGTWIADCRASSSVWKRFVRRPIKPALLNLVVCVPVDKILNGDYADHSQAEPYKNKTLSYLEKMTNKGLIDTLDRIYLDYQGRAIEVDCFDTGKVLFKSDEKGELLRCFQLAIPDHQPRYQMLLSIAKLKIKFKQPWRSLFLLANGNFTAESFQYLGDRALMKNITRRKRDSPFCNRREQIEQCLQKQHIEKHKRVATASSLVVDKDQIDGNVWNQPGQSEEIDKTIWEHCEKTVPNEPCTEIQFINGDQIEQPDSEILSLDLGYESVISTEYDPAFHVLAVNMVDLLVIFYGPFIFILLMALSSMCTLKDNKVCSVLIYTICSLGFLLHVYCIFGEVLTGDLQYDHHFELSEHAQAPDIIFCFQAIDEQPPDVELTGNQLEEATKEISVVAAFSGITYRNEANEWVTANLADGDKKFQIQTFYMANRKCFSFKTDFVYDRKSLLLSGDNRILKVNFNRSFVEERPPHLMTRIQDTMQFSEIVDLSYKKAEDSPLFSLEQEFRRVIRYDRFRLIKNPLSLFCSETRLNDVDAYVRKLAADFTRKYPNHTTLSLPLESAQFKLKINDTLFEKYFADVQNVTDHQAPVNSNYHRLYAINHLRKSSKANGPDFEYGLIFLKRVTIAKASFSWGTLLLALLFAASLWFDLSALGLFSTISDSLDHFHSKVSN